MILKNVFLDIDRKGQGIWRLTSRNYNQCCDNSWQSPLKKKQFVAFCKIWGNVLVTDSKKKHMESQREWGRESGKKRERKEKNSWE